MQEAVLVLGMLMQRFEFVDSFDYELKIKESLTIKPDGLKITLRLRPGRTTGTSPVAVEPADQGRGRATRATSAAPARGTTPR